MAHHNTTPPAASPEEAVTVPFCIVDDAYALLNPRAESYGSLKRLADSEVIALLQQLRGVTSERSFLRDAGRFFSHLFPGVVGLHPSSFNRRLRKLRRFLEPLRRAVLEELAGDPETLVVDSTLLPALHPRRVGQSAGFDGAGWAKWGSFAVYGMKLHLLCSTNRVPLSYELTAANVADVLIVRELLAGAGLEADGLAKRLLGDLAYRSRERSEKSWPGPACCWRPSRPTGGLRSASRLRCASPRSRAPSGWARPWRRRWRDWSRGSPRRSPRTPTGSTSTGCWAGHRGASRSFGRENLATLI